ncbi:MAG: trigger factor [bacterium]|nr:trigger factor [bacterium]
MTTEEKKVDEMDKKKETAEEVKSETKAKMEPKTKPAAKAKDTKPKKKPAAKKKETDTAGKEKKKKETEDKKTEQPTETTETKETETAVAEEKNDSIVEFTIEIKNEEIQSNFEETLAKYAQEVKMPGFRQGKVPIDVIKSRFEGAINEEVVNKLLNDSIVKKIETDKLNIISQPSIKSLDHEPGKDLKAEVVVEIMPEMKLPDLESFEVEIEAKTLEIEPYEEEKTIDSVLQARATQQPVTDRGVKENDYAMLKYQSKILQTKKMTPKKEDNYLVTKEENFDIIDLFDDIVGKNINDKITLKRTYPADYKKKPWAGKDVEHYIEVKSIMEMVKPELDETFVKTQGMNTVDEFKAKLKEEHDNYMKNNIEEKKLAMVMAKLSDAVDINIPAALLEQEMSRMMQQNPYQFNNMQDKQPEELINMMKGNAAQSIKGSFIIEAVEKEFKLEVTGDDLEAEFKKAAEQSNGQVDIKEVRKFYMKKENLGQLKSNLLRTKVFDLIKEKVKIKEV